MIARRDPRRRRSHCHRLAPEILEDRRLLASLASIASLTVPAQQGYTLPLDGSGTTDAQIFTITRTSGSPDITASIAQGPFWTMNIQYTDPTDAADDFSGPLVFQLFQDLTPNTVSQIEEFTNDGYYTGKNFARIASGFPGSSDDILQAGAPNPNGSGSSGQPGTPFLNENVQQLAFTGTDQLAMANAGVDTSLSDASQGVNTNDTQFFITTTGSPNSGLGYGYTIFGQMIAGQSTLTKMTQVPLVESSVYGAQVEPANPLIMSSLSLSTTNPSGVALIDTTQARPGDTATFQVTAIDPTNGSTVTQSFTVTAGAYGGPTYPAIDFQPLADPVSATVADGSTTTVSLAGQDGYPAASSGYGGTLSYSLVSQPSHGTVSQFNATNGTFVYTPQPGYSGSDTIQYEVQENGPPPFLGYSSTDEPLFGPSTTTTSAPATVSLTVTPAAPAVTPTINWSDPADITYGTALTGTQLDATSPVPGSFVYSPPLGTDLKAGAGQTLSVAITPTDLADYTPATAQVTINVDKATPAITWPNPAAITYGTALSSSQLDATSRVPGTFTYTPAPGTVLGAGAGQTLSVTFTPADTADYNTTTAQATITVDKATPTINWADPASITAGTALGPAQLDATSPVAGTFAYTPAAGTVLQAGAGQTLSVLFTPTDSADYTAATASVVINVAAATPVVTGTPTVVGTLADIQDLTNNHHQVTAVSLVFDGSVDTSAAASTSTYLLIKQGKHGSFVASASSRIKIKSASYDPSTHTVTLIPKKPFVLSKPVEVLIGGKPARTL